MRKAVRIVGERASVNVGKKGRDIQRGDGLGVGIDLVGYRAHTRRCIVGRIDGDDKICCIGAAFAITDGVSNGRHCAVPVGIRREGVGAVGPERKAADTGDAYLGADIICGPIDSEARHVQSIGIRVRVVIQHIASDWRAILAPPSTIVDGNWRRAFVATATSSAKGGKGAAASQNAQQNGPPCKTCHIIELDFGEVEFGPFLRILAPPSHAIIIFQHELVATCVLIRPVGCLRSRFPGVVRFRIFDKKAANGNLLTIFQHQHQIVTATLVASHIFRRQFKEDYRGSVG